MADHKKGAGKACQREEAPAVTQNPPPPAQQASLAMGTTLPVLGIFRLAELDDYATTKPPFEYYSSHITYHILTFPPQAGSKNARHAHATKTRGSSPPPMVCP